MVKHAVLLLEGAQVKSLVWELRSCMLCGTDKKKIDLIKKRERPKLQDPSQGSLPGTQHCVHMHMFLLK